MGRIEAKTARSCESCGNKIGGKSYKEILFKCDYCGFSVGQKCCGNQIMICNECGKDFCHKHIGYDLHGSRICDKCVPDWVKNDPNMRRYPR